jgi:DNA mismatch repair protein MutS2
VAATQVRKAAAHKREHQVRVAVQSRAPGVPEINLLGLRVHEALPRLEAFLDQAVLSHQPSVRIVHGMGTGALRRAVREYLANSPYCASYDEAPRVEGGGGVTIAELTL